MKSAKEITDRVKMIIDSMLKRPLMYGDSPVSYEGMMLTMLETYTFAMDKQGSDERITDLWRKFVNKANGYSGAKPVSAWLKDRNELDDKWTQLTTLFNSFFEAING